MSAQVPVAVIEAIARALGIAEAHLTPLTGGTNRRSFVIEHAGSRWATRVEPAPADSLQRAIAAQARARSAGVRAPETIAHDITDDGGERYAWSVETFIAGQAFDHSAVDTPEARATIADLGEQLRRLHSIEVDAFGDLPPRPYPVYATWEDWVANKRRRIDGAVHLAGDDPDAFALSTAVHTLYQELAALYLGPPRLCKGDCAGDNLLVANGRIAAIIDWEWAQGLDPAADVAYWCRATPDAAAHKLLLAAYVPDDAPNFERRVHAHLIVQCIETIHVLDEHRHAFAESEQIAGIRAEWDMLRQLIEQR